MARSCAVLGAAAATACALRWASAIIVIIGLVPEAVGNPLPSPIHAPLTSCNSPHGSATLVRGRCPFGRFPSGGRRTTSSPAPQAGFVACRDERVEVLALAPRRGVDGCGKDLLGAGRFMQAGLCLDPFARVAEVELVGQRVRGHCLAGAIDPHPAVAAVPQQGDQRGAMAEVRHHSLVAGRFGVGERRCGQGGRVLRALD